LSLYDNLYLFFRLLLFYMKYYVLAPIIICCDVTLDSTQVIRTEGYLMKYDAFCPSFNLCMVFTPDLIFSIHHCSINRLSNANRNWDKIPLFLTQTISHQAFTLTHAKSCQTKGGFSAEYFSLQKKKKSAFFMRKWSFYLFKKYLWMLINLFITTVFLPLRCLIWLWL